MKYNIQATQTIYKYFEVEATHENDALEKAQTMVADGEIHFNDEPFLKMDVDIRIA